MRITLIGDDLNLNGTEALLPTGLALTVSHVAHGAGAFEALLAEHPDLVLFDISLPVISPVLAYMDAHPAALVIGINPADQTATVLSGETYPAASAQELAHLIALAYASVRNETVPNAE